MKHRKVDRTYWVCKDCGKDFSLRSTPERTMTVRCTNCHSDNVITA